MWYTEIRLLRICTAHYVTRNAAYISHTLGVMRITYSRCYEYQLGCRYYRFVTPIIETTQAIYLAVMQIKFSSEADQIKC